MRQTISAPIAAILALTPPAAATPRAHAQLFRQPSRPTSTQAAAPNPNAFPTAPSRGALQSLRNGLDYLDKYGDAPRALTYLAEARRRQAELSPDQRKQLADAWIRAERIVAGIDRPTSPIARRTNPHGQALTAQRLPSLPPDTPELADALHANHPTTDPNLRVATTNVDLPPLPTPTPRQPHRPVPAPPLLLEPDDPQPPTPADDHAPEPPSLEPHHPEPDNSSPLFQHNAIPTPDPTTPQPPPTLDLDPEVAPATTPTPAQEPVAATPLTLDILDAEPTPANTPDLPAPAELSHAPSTLPTPTTEAPQVTPQPGPSQTNPPISATPLTLETLNDEPSAPLNPDTLPTEPPPSTPPAPQPEITPTPTPDTGILLIPPPPRHRAEPDRPTLPTTPLAEPNPIDDLPPLPPTPTDTTPAPAHLPPPPPELPRPVAPEISTLTADLPPLPTAAGNELAPPPPAAAELPPLPAVASLPPPPLRHAENLPPIQIHRPEVLREVEEIARRMEEEASRNPIVYPPPTQDEPEPTTSRPGSDRGSALVPRAPSPTEARPIRPIPVPDDFVPLEQRRFAPTRKYFAAAANCNMPLYFQDAALERYGQSVEQALGPHWGRYFSYPLDDPRQTTQRNQLLQPFYSTGLFALQIAALPVHMLFDPPWEAQYDLGFHRPGDPTPPDLIYWPKLGIGPPGHGRKY